MHAGSVGLTNVAVDSTGDITELEPVHFSIHYIEALSGNHSLFRVRLGMRPSADMRKPGPLSEMISRNILSFYITDKELQELYIYTASAYGPPPSTKTLTVTFPTAKADGTADGLSVTYVVYLVHYTQATNIYVFSYSYTLMDAKNKPVQTVSFELTNSDSDGMFAVISGLNFSNPPVEVYP